MGGTQALMEVGHSLLIFHAAATIFSGLIAASIFLPPTLSSVHIRPSWIAVFCFFVAGLHIQYPELSQALLSSDASTQTLSLLNAVGGSLMAVAGLKLIGDIRKNSSAGALIFGGQFVLYGALALFLNGSAMWNYAWWADHFMRLLCQPVGPAKVGVAFEDISAHFKAQRMKEEFCQHR